jgi:hypothetical protein
MPHRPGHNRFGSSTGSTGGPAGMGSPPPSQNFGSNVVIGGGGNPGDAGGSTSRPPQGPVGGPPPPQSSPPPQGPVGGPPPPSPTPPPPDDDDDDDKNILQEAETMLDDFATAGKKLGTSISDLMGIGPLFTFGKEIGKSFNATNNFYNNLLTKGLDGMDDRELVTYGNLLGQGIEDSTLQDFISKNNLNPDEIGKLADGVKVLKDEITGKDYEGIVSAYKAGQPQGFKDSVAGLFGLREPGPTGPVDTPSNTLTRGDAIDKIGKAGMAFLDKTNPRLYDELQPYATMQGVEKLASRSLQGLTNSPEDRRYAARIMEARALAADKQSRQDANMAGSSPAFAPPTQPGTPPGTQPPGTQPPPTPPGATPVPAPPSGTTPTPFDYSQFPQFNMSDYARQGLGATPQFGDFNETLNRFFRFS